MQNAQRLRQWIGYMHKYLDAIAPRRVEVLRMSTFERRVRLAEQTELRQYIASYDRTVKRVASASRAGDLEERYLALLLQAIEAQCLLEGYPGMRSRSRRHSRNAADADDDFDADGAACLRIVEGQESNGQDDDTTDCQPADATDASGDDEGIDGNCDVDEETSS